MRHKPGDPIMTPDQFQAEQSRLGLTNAKLSSILRVSERAVEKWRQGSRAIPGPVAVIFSILRNNPDVILP